MSETVASARHGARWRAAAGLSALLAAGLAALVFTAAQRIDRAGVLEATGQMTGLRPVAAGPATLRLFPALGLRIDTVALHDWGARDDAAPRFSAATMTVTLSPWAALLGRIDITDVAFERAELRLEAGDAPAGSDASMLPGAGSRLAAAAVMRRLAGPGDPMALPGARMLPDTIRLSDSRLLIEGGAGRGSTGQGVTRVIDAIDAELRLATGDPSALAFGTARIEGEAAAFRLRTGDLVGFVAGEDVSLSGTLLAPSLDLRLEGRGGLRPQPYFNGSVSVEAASLPRATAWIGWVSPVQTGDMPVRVTGTMDASMARIDLSDLRLVAGGNAGRGALSVTPGPGTPMVGGSLDFETLDLDAFARSFLAPALRVETSDDGRRALNLDLDLRFSARTASAGDVMLRDVAATTRIDADLVALDVNTAEVFGGTVQLALKAPRSGGAQAMELRVLAEGVRIAALGELVPVLAARLDARADASVILSGPITSAEAFAREARGSMKFNAGAGRFNGISLGELVDRIRTGAFERVEPAGGDGIAFNEVLAEASIGNGLFRLDKFRAGLGDAAITLSGTHSVRGGNLALAGAVTLDAGHPLGGDGEGTLPFFIGGSLAAPFLSAAAPAVAPGEALGEAQGDAPAETP